MVWLWSNSTADMLISSLLILRLWQSRQTQGGAPAGQSEAGKESRTEVLISSVGFICTGTICFKAALTIYAQLMRLSFETAVLTTFTAIAAAAC